MVYEINVENGYCNSSDEDGDPTLVVGQYSPVRQIIRISDKLKQTGAVATLWHEIIHAIADQRDIQIGERQIDHIAFIIMELLQDNPWLAQVTMEKPGLYQDTCRAVSTKASQMDDSDFDFDPVM